MKKLLFLFAVLAFTAAAQAKEVDPNDRCKYTDGSYRNISGCRGAPSEPITPGQKDVPGSEAALKACAKGSPKCRCESTGGAVSGC